MAKHISIRVPWHDNEWSGSVCKCPENNPFCMVLRNIADSKNVDNEMGLAGRKWCKLTTDQLPACKGENGGFMNDKGYKRLFKHVYAYGKTPHTKLRPTMLEIPPYAILGVPFRYMAKDCKDELERKCPDLPKDEEAPFRTSWIYGGDRQRAILNMFKKEVVEDSSIVVFYCKKGNPVDDEAERLIVGLGDITKVHDVMDYDTTADYTYPFWEIIMEHSIRKSLKDSKGFLLPYSEYLKLDEDYIFNKTGKTKTEAIDEIKLTLDKLGCGKDSSLFWQLSFGCEHVSNNNMLIILNGAKKCVQAVIDHKLVGGDWRRQLSWIDERIAHVKNMIGPFPSFAEALKCLGFSYAYMIEQDLRNGGYCGAKDNPWEVFELLIDGKLKLNMAVYDEEIRNFKAIWLNMPERKRSVLELLSRFELTEDDIEYFIKHTELYDMIIANPYIVSEELGHISPDLIDAGIIEDPTIQGKNLPQSPSVVKIRTDIRRIRAFAIHHINNHIAEGDTLLSLKEVEDYINEVLDRDMLKLPDGFILSNKDFFEEKLKFIDSDTGTALQLNYYYDVECFLRKKFSKRAKAVVKRPVSDDWETLVKGINGYDENNERSKRAAEDQIKALRMFSERKLCVLTGSAGTGKTSVVKSFIASEQIKKEGVLLLAPTGKARVRLGSMAHGVKSMTIAQFLTRCGCFDWTKMEAFVPDDIDDNKYANEKNIIIDECSMLTCDDFYVLLNALDLAHVNRIILIGDQYQLPPIGCGRPFSDLCNYLKANNKEAITELKTIVRTIVSGESDVLTLASWYKGGDREKNADEIFDRLMNNDLSNDLRVYTWKDESELKARLKEVMENEKPDYPDANIADWQVLTPVINPVWGTFQINQYFQEWLKHTNKRYAIPYGSLNLYKGDKVMQCMNEKRKEANTKVSFLLSNGQIGQVVEIGNKSAFVSFPEYPDKRFFYYGVKNDDGADRLDLAYAISIHKSQGSDFGTAIVVLPKNCRLLSRELIYTALTRAKNKLVLLVEDSPNWLYAYSKPQYSVLAKRNTNLFSFQVRQEKNHIPYVEGLIHKTKKDGLIVRSKSEVIIANELINSGLKFEYERELQEGVRTCYPDFTFVDDCGEIIIWEHLGMLDLPSYKESWEKKLAFYHSIGYKEGENLFTTQDGDNGAFNTMDVLKVIEEIKEVID